MSKKTTRDTVEAIRKARTKLLSNKTLATMDLDYDYPFGVDLRPQSNLTKFLFEEINERCAMAREVQQDWFPEMKAIDQTLSGYMPASDVDNIRKEKDARKLTTIVVPMSYAIRESLCAFTMNTFCSGKQIHKYRGMGGAESFISAALRERVVARQSYWFKERRAIDNWASDAFSYGRGTVALKWSKHKARTAITSQITEGMAAALTDMGMKVNAGELYRDLEERVIREGTEMQVLDQYRCFYDPKVAGAEIQESEFFGWQYETSAMDLLKRETDPEEGLFNGKAVRLLADQQSARSEWWLADDGRGRTGDSDRTTDFNDRRVTTTVHVTSMLMNIIPNEWALGDDDRPCWYWIEIAGDQVVIRLDKLDFEHGQIPVVCIAPNGDGHRATPVSQLYLVKDFQRFGNWLLKSRGDAVNTILNGIVFADESVVNMDDLMNPGNGKIVRINSSHFGERRVITDYIGQLQMTDPTVGHLANVNELDQIARNALGVTDIQMGQMGQLPERPTARGIGAAQSGSGSRLALLMMRIDEDGMRDVAYQMAMNTGQFMGMDMSVPIIGRYEQQLRQAYGLPPGDVDVPVFAEDMDFPFEVEPHSNFSDRDDDITAMSEFMKTMMAVPGVVEGLAQDYRLADVFAQFLEKAGFDDIQEYRNQRGPINTQIEVQPDDEVAKAVQAGNLVGAGA